MTVSAKVYGLAMQSMLNKEIDWDTDTIKCVLLTSSHTPDQDTHRYESSLTNELSGGSYARQTLGSKTITYNTSTNVLTLDCADITFAAMTASAIRYAVIVDTQSGSASTNPLLCYIDFGADQAVTAQDFTVIIASTGLATFTAA